MPTVMLIVEVLGAQTPLEIDHSNTFTPSEALMAALVFCVGATTVTEPDIKVHEPVPTEGALAFRVTLGLEIHASWFGPAEAISGASSVMIVIVETLEQGPLLSVH